MEPLHQLQNETEGTRNRIVASEVEKLRGRWNEQAVDELNSTGALETKGDKEGYAYMAFGLATSELCNLREEPIDIISAE